MNDYIYCMYDKLSARFGSPFAACNDMVAARLALMIKGGYNPAFDILYRIGIFANSCGQIEGSEPVDISESVKQVLAMVKASEEKPEGDVENG
nr:DNA binding protein [Microvirus sp.]